MSERARDGVTGEMISDDSRRLLGPDHRHDWRERTRRHSRKTYQTCWCGRHERTREQG